MGMSGAGGGVGGRRGELVGAQGVLSAGWLINRQKQQKMAVAIERLHVTPRVVPPIINRKIILTYIVQNLVCTTQARSVT